MANRDDIPKTDPSEIETLIQRLKRVASVARREIFSHRLYSGGTPYMIFEVIAALKVSNSLSVQQ